jgi:hypothetical protein
MPVAREIPGKGWKGTEEILVDELRLGQGRLSENLLRPPCCQAMNAYGK